MVEHTHLPPHAPSGDAAKFWEQRYESASAVWSGRVNATLALIAGELVPGRSLDLGCGEGGDAIWLATQGWRATGIDISATAVQRATDAAAAAEISADHIRFVAADLSTMGGRELTAMDLAGMDLVSASFLQSPFELPRAAILQAAARLVAPGGHLVLVSHAAAPPWANFGDGPAPVFPTPASELADLGLQFNYGSDLSTGGVDGDRGVTAEDSAGVRSPIGAWQKLRAEVVYRDVVAPSGEPATLEDTLVVLRRVR
jgi:SAM-dependent methyltransferase